jgi:alkanesulfonate monooxygenase SsuD/methylene tetrahydromethanopterin reductase-like flavin-dependent oxidoreductase (luciferase family)
VIRARIVLAAAEGATGRRNPAVTAQAAATLHLLTRGRANLGIGTGQREGNEPLASTGPSRWPGSRRRWPQIWIASHRPRMLRATGRYADGWFPAIPKAPHEYKENLGVVRSAASAAGRDPVSITPAIWLFVIIGRTLDAVEETPLRHRKSVRTQRPRRDLGTPRRAASPRRRLLRRAGSNSPSLGQADGAIPCGEKCRCHC